MHLSLYLIGVIVFVDGRRLHGVADRTRRPNNKSVPARRHSRAFALRQEVPSKNCLPDGQLKYVGTKFCHLKVVVF